MKFNLLYILFFALIGMMHNSLNAQHGNNWAFGYHSGLRFTPDGVEKIQTRIEMDTFNNDSSWAGHGLVSYSDCNGDLLVYGSIRQLWNRFHYTIEGSYNDKITGNEFNLLLPQPGSDRYFYWFYHKKEFGADSFCYSIVDLLANNGKGLVVKKNIPILNRLSQSLSFSPHANGRDIWLLYGYDNKTMYSYLLSDTGLSATPVVSNNVYIGSSIYPEFKYELYWNYSPRFRISFPMSAIKVNPQGNKLITCGVDSVTNDSACVWEYKFDNSTGIASAGLPIFSFDDLPDSKIMGAEYFSNISAVEFSPNDSFYYFFSSCWYGNLPTEKASNFIWQYNVNTRKKTVVYSNKSPILSSALCPFGKIYFYEMPPRQGQYYNSSYGLGCIQHPNEKGKLVGVKNNLQDSIGFILGLPQTYSPYRKLFFSTQQTTQPCADSVILNLTVDTNYRNLMIFFGDGDSLLLNSPLKHNYRIAHLYPLDGGYKVSLRSLNPICESYSYYSDSFHFIRLPQLHAHHRFTSVSCDTFGIIFNDSVTEVNRVFYDIDSSTDTAALVDGIYKSQRLVVRGEQTHLQYTLRLEKNGCPAMVFKDSIALSYLAYPSNEYNFFPKPFKDSIQLCNAQSLFVSDTSILPTTRLLSWGDGDWSLRSISGSNTHTYPPGTYELMIKDSAQWGCVSRDTFYIHVFPSDTSDLEVLDMNACQNQNYIVIQDKGRYAMHSSLSWYTNTDSAQLQKGATLKLSFPSSGIYNFKMRSHNLYGCSSELDTFFEIYPSPVASVISFQDSQCLKGNVYVFSAIDTVGISSYNWVIDTSVMQFHTSSFLHSFATSGNHTIEYTVENKYQCKDTVLKSVYVQAALNLETSINDSLQCLKGNSINLRIKSDAPNYKSKVLWGDGQTNELTSDGDLTHVYALYPVGGKYKISVLVTQGVCTDSSSHVIKLAYPELPKISAKGYCDDAPSYFECLNCSGTQQWWVDGQLQGNTQSLEHQFSDIGLHLIRLKTQTQQVCATDTSFNFRVYAKPKSEFHSIRKTYHSGSYRFYFENRSTGHNGSLWEFENGDTSMQENTEYIYRDTGWKRVLLITNTSGMCYDSIRKRVPVFGVLEFYFPTAFSPDGNQINDGFGLHPMQREFVREYSLEVYNRWGQKVFATQDMNQAWVPSADASIAGMYIYTVRIRDVFYELHEFGGVVLLKL